MASVVEICNKALSLLGQNLITDFSENTPEALACRTHWPFVRNQVLRSHPWNCAIERKAIPRLLDAPVNEFTYKYQLPADCLRVLSIDPDQIFSIEGRTLLCDTDSIILKYIKELSDSSQYDPELADALSYIMASELCYQMTSSTSQVDYLRTTGEEKLSNAKASDALEGRQKEVRQTAWIRAKYGYGGN